MARLFGKLQVLDIYINMYICRVRRQTANFTLAWWNFGLLLLITAVLLARKSAIIKIMVKAKYVFFVKIKIIIKTKNVF